ncbi:MAG: hypothetical protein AAFN42_04025 [Cyanobacteria bacterium J06554_1]
MAFTGMIGSVTGGWRFSNCQNTLLHKAQQAYMVHKTLSVYELGANVRLYWWRVSEKAVKDQINAVVGAG